MEQSPGQGLRRRVPSTKPPFTLGELKSRVPKHCFESSLLRSCYYLARDVALLCALSLSADTYIPSLAWPLQWVAWPIYWAAAGTVAFGLWFHGHECIHDAFSNHKWINDAVGFVVFTGLLVPYFPWKCSHIKHHANTGTLEKDEAVVPKQRPSKARRFLNNRLGRILIMGLMLTIGYPVYLLFHITGRRYPQRNNHFWPFSPMIPRRMRLWVLLSDTGVLAVLVALAWLVNVHGVAWLAIRYWAPYMVVNAWLVASTLNHAHPALAHYDEDTWDWLLGTLTCTMDRDFGPLLNWVFHDGLNFHMVHHVFPRIPHYHLREATEALKPVLGEYYHSDATPPHRALYQVVKECVFVREDVDQKGVYWYEGLFDM
nr:PREDICTED: delta(12) fatty acid desaturase FAD2-like [Bemisia tabaci]